MTQFAAPPSVAFGDSSARQVYEHLGMLCRVIVDGAMTGGAFSIVEERARLGCLTPRHVHSREAETFLVLDGALEGWAEGRTQLVEAGNLVYLPPNQEHAFRIASDSAHFLTLITPAGFETFFEQTGVPLRRPFDGALPVPGPITPEAGAALARVLEPLGCAITGPPPFDAA